VVLPIGTSWGGSPWDGSLRRVIVDRRLWGLCDLFESRVCDDRETARE
jgi:hypothetical protein